LLTATRRTAVVEPSIAIRSDEILSPPSASTRLACAVSSGSTVTCAM
jgi:hypothetical protein